MATILGTFGDDTLAATAAGDLVQGRAGNDLITTTFNETTLEGGNGIDVLIATSDVDVVAPDTDVVIAQSIDGGIGNDEINFQGTLDLADGSDGSSGSILSFAVGGFGRDTISIDNTVTSSSLSFAGAAAFVDSGTMNDTVDVKLSASSAAEAGVFAFIETGTGEDLVTITASATAMIDGQSFAQLAVDLGNGDDSLTAFLSASRVEAGVFGGFGNDEMTVNVSGDGPGSTASILLFGGGGNDTMTVGFGVGVDGTAELFGGGGSDRLAVVGGSGSTLAGGAGSDFLTGSAAADVFLFGDETVDGAVHRDEITNYSKAQGDVVAVAGGEDAIASWSIVGGSTRLFLEGDGDLIILRNLIITGLSDMAFEDTLLIP
jgi:serralysin